MTEEFRHIVRISGTDLDGSKRVGYGLSKIRGIDVSLAQALVKVAGLDPKMQIGRLSEGDVSKLEEAIRNPADLGVPAWMLNRQKDLESGKDSHLVGSDLTLRVKMDIEFMKSIQSWKGTRHSLGLKVRGQRTKTSGRTGRVIGVAKKAVAAAATAARAEKGEAKKE
jgi:small subunit ribosomal protein S13